MLENKTMDPVIEQTREEIAALKALAGKPPSTTWMVRCRNEACKQMKWDAAGLVEHDATCDKCGERLIHYTLTNRYLFMDEPEIN